MSSSISLLIPSSWLIPVVLPVIAPVTVSLFTPPFPYYVAILVYRRPPPRAARGWKPPSQWPADEIVRNFVSLGGSARANVRKVLERDREAPRELRAAAALGDEWTHDLVSMAQEDALSVGVGCRLQDAIQEADKRRTIEMFGGRSAINEPKSVSNKET